MFVIDIYYCTLVIFIKMAKSINWDKLVGDKVKSMDGEEIGIENKLKDSIEVKDGLIAEAKRRL